MAAGAEQSEVDVLEDFGSPVAAAAICDRLVHRAHRLMLKGPTMRDPEAKRGKGKS
jgi:hypothetical protein